MDHGFDEALISGYLDHELTQAEHQRIRLHLEECPSCRSLAREFERLREAAMTTRFPVPDDRQWDETPRGGLSAMFRNFGWALMLFWVVGLAAFGVWRLISHPENLWQNLLVFGLWLGFGLVFLSVLLDRLKTYKTDRYRRVEK